MTGLYKAKRKDNGDWVLGGLITNIMTDSAYIGYVFFSDGEKITESHFSEVDPNTACQYIGKDDRIGRKIWEHDVISINTYDYMEPAEDFFGEVVYCESWACWCIKQPGDEKPIPLCECEGSYKTEIEIHGNVFDNPDLMKGTVE